MKHISVLLEESINALNLQEDSIVVDMTLGLGGHSKEILKKIPKGFLYCFDQDEDSIKIARERLSEFKNYEIIKSNFQYIKKELMNRNANTVDAILYDLGVSSPQLDNAERGFSFHNDARLDMRMDKDGSISAYEIVNNYSEAELLKIFREYGEEKYSTSIARNIVKERNKKPIETTLELVEVIKYSVPEKYKREGHPARRIFQAIRIEVNKELEVFETALKDSLDMLNINGRIAVITFHSLEDKICKTIFKKVSEVDSNLKRLPVIPENLLPNFKMIGSKKPTKEELEDNNRARSSKLRIIERTK